MKGEKEQQKRCKKAVEYWAGRLGMLQWVDLKIRFTTDMEGDRVAARCSPDWEYKQASIEFNLTVTSVMDDAHLHSCVIHELVHILVAPMADKVKQRDAKLEEVSVEQVTQAIMAAVR